METPTPSAIGPQVSVIIPARNEEANLRTCLESLTEQDFHFEVIVVDDHSTDRTKEIAQSFPGVRVIDAPPLPAGWTGKNNAVAAGAAAARTSRLLFTDADTVHLPGSLERAFYEARKFDVDLLSYSPDQITITFWERATLPVVFAALSRQYPPSKVSDPNSPEAAANGQFLMIDRYAYEQVGGHAAVAGDILEDVALARLVKASGRKIRFRYAADAVRTRMYRNFHQLREGWTKNLALLFPHPGRLAADTFVSWGLPFLLLIGPFVAMLLAQWTNDLPALATVHLTLGIISRFAHFWWWFVLILIIFSVNVAELRRANFGFANNFLGALFGMPMFAYLLLRSQRAHAKGDVSWKGRSYGDAKPSTASVIDHSKTVPEKTL